MPKNISRSRKKGMAAPEQPLTLLDAFRQVGTRPCRTFTSWHWSGSTAPKVRGAAAIKGWNDVSWVPDANAYECAQNPSVVLHIPHSSAAIPAADRRALLLSDNELRTEILRMTDWFTDQLFISANCPLTAVRYPVSRLVLDPERFEDDAQEIMSKKGMGVVYTSTSDGRVLRNAPNDAERRTLIERYYTPHHARLSNAVTQILEKTGKALVIDCHSFPTDPLPYELDQRPDRPDICIGTDAFHSPAWLSELAVSLFRRSNVTVEVNRPFCGALVPQTYYQTNANVSGVMVEINRGLYMDERTGKMSAKFDECRAMVSGVLSAIVVHYGARDAIDLTNQ
jgi:N-formylglutamate amidohydrolase